MKSVLISIQPKWVEKICKSEKTIEVRKNKPNLATPFKCYIYCTKDNKTAFNNHNGNMFLSPKGWQEYSECNGKVIGEFICDRIYDLPCEVNQAFWLKQKTCISDKHYQEYLGHKDGYGWHISDLKIYDKPKELSEFKHFKGKDLCCLGCKHTETCYVEKVESCMYAYKPLKRPPQSWCYIESLGE